MMGKLKADWKDNKAGSILKIDRIEEYRRLIELGILEPFQEETTKKQVGRPPKDKMIKAASNK